MKRVPLDEKLYPGTIVRTETDEAGSVTAKRLPWFKSDTQYGATGSGQTRLKKRNHPEGILNNAPLEKRAPQVRAAQVADMLWAQFRTFELTLGRPVTRDDIPDPFLKAMGLQLWKKDEVITYAHMLRIAGIYLDAVERGAGKDVRFQPQG